MPYGDDGGTILSVNGQSQDSRRSPIKAARDFVAKYSSPQAGSPHAGFPQYKRLSSKNEVFYRSPDNLAST
jgi:hypothetical protein